MIVIALPVSGESPSPKNMQDFHEDTHAERNGYGEHPRVPRGVEQSEIQSNRLRRRDLHQTGLSVQARHCSASSTRQRLDSDDGSGGPTPPSQRATFESVEVISSISAMRSTTASIPEMSAPFTMAMMSGLPKSASAWITPVIFRTLESVRFGWRELMNIYAQVTMICSVGLSVAVVSFYVFFVFSSE